LNLSETILEAVIAFRKEHREDMAELRTRLDKTDSDVSHLETELAVVRAQMPRSNPWKVIGLIVAIVVLALSGLPPEELAKLAKLMPW
jgi:hypothetical protein